MFNIRKEDHDLNKAIADVYKNLNGEFAESDDYAAQVDQLTKLYALKNKSVDPNVLITVAGNIAIGIAVIKYEQLAVVSTKVWSFLART